MTHLPTIGCGDEHSLPGPLMAEETTLSLLWGHRHDNRGYRLGFPPSLDCSHVAWRRLDWLADDAVSCEPVSAPNSLLTGKITGNFSESGHPRRFSCLINGRIQWLTTEFPTQRNREFPNAYQGIFYEEQGNCNQSNSETAELRCDAMLCMVSAVLPSDRIDASQRTDAWVESTTDAVVWSHAAKRSVIIPTHRTGRADLRHPALRLFHCKTLLLGHSSSPWRATPSIRADLAFGSDS